MAIKGKIQQALQNAKLRRSGDLTSNLGVTPPSNVSDAKSTTNSLPIAQRRSAIEKTLAAPKVAFDRQKCLDNRILVDGGENPLNHPAMAAYRMLRTRLGHRARANNWRIIGITSSGAGDGKTVTALNLALAVAREKNNNVFLIDLDMRNPKVCEYLGVVPPAEVNDFFTGAASVNDILFSIGIENLTLAGTRTSSEHSSELLATGRIEELFDHIRQVFAEPIILVDLPPILTTDDALVMAPKLDAWVLVLAEGRSRRDSTAKSLEILEDFNIAGIVLNRSKATVADAYNT